MANGVRTARSRGTLCGLALIVLGGWGGVAPFAGPSLGYGFTPDTAWTLNHGRLFLSAIPGAVALVAGLIIAVTRSRAIGGFFALIAALGGAWFIAGAGLVKLLPASIAGSITTGTPIETGAHRIILTALAFYAGTGALIVFFAALALGRFSIAAYRDYVEDAGLGGVTSDGALDFSAYQAGQGSTTAQPLTAAPQYPPPGPFGLTEPEPQYPPDESQFPASQPPFPPAQYPTSPDPFGATQTGYSPSGYPPGGYSQPTVAEPDIEQVFGQQDPGSPAP
jgi:hypothetical protein